VGFNVIYSTKRCWNDSQGLLLSSALT